MLILYSPPVLLYRIDGGVCNNNFLMTLISDLLGVTLDRPKHVDMANLGAAFLAGLAAGKYNVVSPQRQIMHICI